MNKSDEVLNNLKLELRKGILVLGVLSQLQEKHYGYSLNEQLNNKNLNIEQNTLYPLLRRLETQGLLESLWDTEGSRPRKYYLISEYGLEIYELLKKEYLDNHQVLLDLFK